MKKTLIALATLLVIPTSFALAQTQPDGQQQASIRITQQELETKFMATSQENTLTTSQETQQNGTQELKKEEGFTIMPMYPNTVNPRKFLFEIKPGEQGTEEAYIKNFSDEPITVLLYGADTTVSNTGSLAYKTRQNVNDGAGSWIKFEEPTVDLKPQEGKKVRFFVNVPKDTSLGDYKAGIAIEKTKKDINNPSITIATRVIIHAEIKVTNDPKPIEKGPPAVKETAPAWKQYYFWGSLILFLLSTGLLIWVSLKDRKEKTHSPKKSEQTNKLEVEKKKHTKVTSKHKHSPVRKKK